MKVKGPFIEAMRHATQLVRTRGPMAATRFIQGLLHPKRATPQSATVDEDESVVVVDQVIQPVTETDTQAPPRPWTLPSASGQFLGLRYSGHAGSRNYKLYIPSGDNTKAIPLVVMLHGCTQNPDDFATGTRANRWAEDKR